MSVMFATGHGVWPIAAALVLDALLRFRQICCHCVMFQPLPWFSKTSSLQSIGSNARAGFLDLAQVWREETVAWNGEGHIAELRLSYGNIDFHRRRGCMMTAKAC